MDITIKEIYNGKEKKKEMGGNWRSSQCQEKSLAEENKT